MLWNTLILFSNGVNRTYRVAVYICSVQTYAHGCVIGLQEEEEEATTSVGIEKFSLAEYHNIKLLGEWGFGTVSLVRRTPASCSGGKRELFALKRVVKCASKNAGSRRIIEKEVFKYAVGHPFLVQLHAYFETMVHYCF
jgi:hypothetical protein